MKVNVLVLGAGISGLTAAYQLQKKGVTTVVIEKQGAVGGRVRSVYLKDVMLDSGALFLVNSYKHAFQLIRDLGMEEQLLPIKTRNGIVARNRIFTLPPRSFIDILSLLPPKSLLNICRMMVGMLVRTGELRLDNLLKSYRLDTETVADYLNRKNDRTLLEYIIDPILQGLWYWHSSSTTKVALYLLLKQAPMMRLYSLRNGMGTLSDAIARHVNVCVETRAICSIYDSESRTWKTTVQDAQGERMIESDIVVCTLPATTVNGIFPDLPGPIKAFFDGIQYTSIITIHLLLNEKTRLPQYYGLYYPSIGTKAIAAVAIQTNKVSLGAEQDQTLVSMYASTDFSRELAGRSEDEIRKAMIEKLEASYPFSQHELSKSISASKIIRLEPALPVFNAGYICTLKSFRETLENDLPPGLFFAGDFVGGPHIEGAVVSAENAVRDAIQFLQK
jgi:protoporphyrinogen/coproporphyrinogen III oxidase